MNLITFEEIFSSPVEPPAVVLVEGEAGTLKSTLCFSLMLDLLGRSDDIGLYMTFEQTWQSHRTNMASLGYIPPDRLLSVDYNIMRKETSLQDARVNIFTSILEMVETLDREKEGKLRIFALDSLNAVYSISDQAFLEYSLVPFFRQLRKHNMISLIIHEKTSPDNSNRLRERFLADGIISLGILRHQGDVVRYLQALKFASGEHSLKRRHMMTQKNGLTLMGNVYR